MFHLFIYLFVYRLNLKLEVKKKFKQNLHLLQADTVLAHKTRTQHSNADSRMIALCTPLSHVTSRALLCWKNQDGLEQASRNGGELKYDAIGARYLLQRQRLYFVVRLRDI